MALQRSRPRPAILVLLVLALTALASPALAQAEPTAAPETLPPEEDEVGGTCLTPRQAYLQLLWWHRKDPAKAAACFDLSGLSRPSVEAPALARRLVQHLDANALRIDTAGAPIDPAYVDPRTNRAAYADPAAPEFVIARQPDGRWLFTAESLARVPAPGLSGALVDRLPGWFRTELLGIQAWQLLGVVLLIFVALLVQRTVVFVIRTYLRTLVSRVNLRYLDDAIHKADRPIGGVVMAGVFHLGFPLLVFPLEVAQIAMVAVKALSAFSIVWLGYRLIDVLALWMRSKAAISDTKLDDQLVPLVTKTLKVFVSVIGGIFVLQNLDVDVGSLLAGVGLGGLAFALAAKDTVANFFGSVMIFIDRPFQIGDWIVLSGVEGTVEEVGFRTTRIRTFYNSLVTVPNSIITNTSVDNYGMREYRRYSTTLGLTYDTPPAKVQAFCEAVRALLAGMPGIRRDYYMVEFKAFGPSSLDIMLYCFMVAESWNEEMRIRTHLNLEILRIADELGVSFAFPTQTLHVETLANPGESRPSHGGPRDPRELVEVIEGFGPDGARRSPKGTPLSAGYDCGPNWKDERWG